MLIKRDLRTQITRLKRCKAEGPASSSGDGPSGSDEPFKKRMRAETVQLAPALSVSSAGVEVEAVGRSSRSRARSVPSRFKDTDVVDRRTKEELSSKSSPDINSSDKNENSSNGDIVLPKSSKSKTIVPKRANSSEADQGEPSLIERVTGSRKRDDPCLLVELEVGEVVWAKSSKASPPWPAIITDPRAHAPQVVLNACVPSAVCVMYFGHAANGNRVSESFFVFFI
jgi:PWWP domain